jgi:hypothetical protein
VGTIGQPDAGALDDTQYSIDGGFWPGVRAKYSVHLPLVVKNNP